MAPYALTIFAGAFLLFQVQPLIGKFILPWFGGGPGVWATCMLFFQALLVGGYGYAFLISRWLKPRTQAALHILLLAAAAAFLPVIPSDAWKPTGAEDPAGRILGLLAATIGLPYFMLASTGPLMQHWFSITQPGRSPYRLFALSNAGSLLALVSYPFFFEIQLTRKAQAEFWGWGLIAYALAAGFSAWTLWRAQSSGHPMSPALAQPSQPAPACTGWTRSRWVLFPACASVLLLATTNKLCLDVAVIPFLWVAPLAVYLITFIIAFDNPRWYARIVFAPALVAALAGLFWAMEAGPDWPVMRQVATYCGGLFVCCLVCHGELYRLRPGPRELTAYYLAISIGGALGGVFVALIAPRLFVDYYELHWGLISCGLLFLAVVLADCHHGPRNLNPFKASPESAPAARQADAASKPHSVESAWVLLGWILPALVLVGMERILIRLWNEMEWTRTGVLTGMRVGLILGLVAVVVILVLRRRIGSALRTTWNWAPWTATWITAGTAILATALWLQARRNDSSILHISRNFYGVTLVYENQPELPESHHLVFQHGRITHGLQFVDPVQATWATTYYGQETGVGVGMRSLPERPRRIGVVGLGAGTMAAYGRASDSLRFYEINPKVVELAQGQFSYLSNCASRVEIALGDARLSLEREAPQNFDLLALDAFSSDSIPVHLLTTEAFGLYQRHLRTNGVLAINISNHYLDLEPVVLKLARRFDYHLAKIDYEERDDAWWVYSSTWMLLSRNRALLESPLVSEASCPLRTNRTNVPIWTDDFASLFQILQ